MWYWKKQSKIIEYKETGKRAKILKNRKRKKAQVITRIAIDLREYNGKMLENITWKVQKMKAEKQRIKK